MSSSDDGDGGPGTREVAHRLFAAEFDDADLEYSESDEERAPNYVVTPTGLRVNRLFAVGVLTEVESVNEQTNRGRIVDPTGAFVTYAGQYQPDEMAFLDRTTPPEFVALTGKARTFEPEDSDVVYTSVRPESFATVDAETRDRWVVSAADATLRRLAVFERALAMDERGDDLRARLEAAGVPAALASGIPVALDHYDTGERYLEAVRTLAVDALEVVADEREEVRELTVAPDDRGGADLGPLPDVPYDFDATPEAPSPGAAEGELTGDEVESTPESIEGEGVEEPVDADAETDAEAEADTGADTGAVADDEAIEDDELGEAADESATATSAPTETAQGEAAADEPGTPAEPGGGGSTTDVEPPEDATEASAEAVEDATAGDDDLERSATAVDTPGGDAGDPEDLGDFDAGDVDDTGSPGDFDASSESVPADESTDTAEVGGDTDPEDLAEADPEDFEDALTDEERREVEEEHGVEFATGSNVPDPGAAGTEEPEADPTAPDEDRDVTTDLDTEPMPSSEGTEPTTEEGLEDTDAGETGAPYGEDPTEDLGVAADETADTDVADSPAAEGDVADEAVMDAEDDAADVHESGDEDVEDVDLEAAVVELMDELDDGDGAAEDDVVAAAVDRYGVGSEDARSAIQDALMSGQCYEPAEGSLKPI